MASFILFWWACGGSNEAKDSTTTVQAPDADADADADADTDSDADADSAHTGRSTNYYDPYKHCHDQCDRPCGDIQYCAVCLTSDTGGGHGLVEMCLPCGIAC